VGLCSKRLRFDHERDGEGVVTARGARVPVSRRPVGVHLVGSVPLESAEAVFRTLSLALGPWLRRVTDGETGKRLDWIGWQLSLPMQPPQFDLGAPDADVYRETPTVKLKEGVNPSDVYFEKLGYADAAIESWRLFASLQRAGAIPP